MLCFLSGCKSVPLLVQENPGQQKTVTIAEVQGERGPGAGGDSPWAVCPGQRQTPARSFLETRSHPAVRKAPLAGKACPDPGPSHPATSQLPSWAQETGRAEKDRVFLASEGLGAGCHPGTTAACILPNRPGAWRR